MARAGDKALVMTPARDGRSPSFGPAYLPEMIRDFVNRFMAHKASMLEEFSAEHPSTYMEIVKRVIEVINPERTHGAPDYERIHEIDDGDYQGTLLYVIAAAGYQPGKYWYVMVDYGSCSGCDTLEAIRGYVTGTPTSEQANEYWTLALHVVQQMRQMHGEAA